MKKIALPVWLLFTTLCLYAQKNKPVNPAKDKMEFHGYTIKLLPAQGGTYGYDILQEKAIILHQTYNPFTMAPAGLKQKEDAYKIAKWQIVHINDQSRATVTNNSSNNTIQSRQTTEHTNKKILINKPLGRNLAKTLNISID